MHPSRRRKKRPNYGIRTVEVLRGPNGFGFTISGQQPCILSCIVANSPADQAGLRAGDFLISVNGLSVSKSTHDSVVNLIGNSIGPIKMTIAENYYSDSSDEEVGLEHPGNVRKPKYMQRPRTHRTHFKNDHCSTNLSPVKKNMRLQQGFSPKMCLQHEIRTSNHNQFLHSYGNDNTNGNVLNQLPKEEEHCPIEYKTLVGYLGTIEMPKQLLPGSRLQTVCSCIRKLRQEKRTPTLVLITVRPTCLTLKNSTNQILAIYPTNRVVYISSASDKDSRYFGLVTSAVCESNSVENIPKYDEPDIEIYNSCHVFATDPKLVEHQSHTSLAENFQIICTPDIITGCCLEFPKSASYIVSLVQNMFKLQDSTADQINVANGNRRRNYEENAVVANSPQPSASSNSDSGIGFRDDCGNISDRILVVEFPAQSHSPVIPVQSKRPTGIDASCINLKSLDLPLSDTCDINNVRSMNDPGVKHLSKTPEDKEVPIGDVNNIRACENLVKNSKNPTDLTDATTEMADRLTVRAMRDPVVLNSDQDSTYGYSERAVDVPKEFKESPSSKSYESISINSVNEDVSDFKSSVDNISVHSSKSIELSHLKSIFKTPSTKLDYKKKKNRMKTVASSVDNLVAETYENSMLSYKLSPKVYGLSKPNCSYEELTSLDNIEKCGYGSLQDLCSWTGESGTKCNLAQSEPDVRVQRRKKDGNFLCEEDGGARNSEGPGAWASSFEKLLDDPVGLQAFAEFLKKEFSAENIYFWTSCERFRRLPPGSQRTEEARKIYQKHLCVGAPEPVNVDSQGRQCTENLLLEASPTLFEQAQKQIFNLMKFDSYPRFLKSDLYKQCLAGTADINLDAGLLIQPHCTPNKLKKSLSNAEDRRRKSLLPWHRKNRSKSKDRGESEYGQKNDDSHQGNDCDIHSSKSSLISQESTKGIHEDCGRGPLCRVILCNGSTTVVQIKQEESIEQIVQRVLDKRGIIYTSFEVFTDKHPKALNIREPSIILAGCEVRIEQRVVFKLDLPNRKVIAVKSKSTKLIIDVLKPILNKYDYQLEQVAATIGGKDIIDITQPVTSIDGIRLNIQLREEVKKAATQKCLNGKLGNPSLDEITNKVFKELLHEKAEVKHKSTSDKGSVKSEDWGSEHSSGIFGRFLRRDSGLHEKKKKVACVRTKGSSHSSSEDVSEHSGIKKPLIAKWKSGVHKLHVGNSESDELYEGLKRAQRSRLEDQRGTEINFELPDFLKDKENTQKCQNRFRKIRRTGTLEEKPIETESVLQFRNASISSRCNYENRSIINCNDQLSQNEKINSRLYSPNKQSSDESSKSTSSTPSKSSLNNTVVENVLKNQLGVDAKNNEPPPLPPKPKVFPIRPSNWGQNSVFKVPRPPRVDQSKSGLYLEQPTSSFV